MKKNIINYITAGVLAMTAASCGNDWLDLEPSTSVVSKVETASDVKFTLNGIYSDMQSAYAYSGRLVYYGDVTGDDMQAVSSTKRTASAYLYGFTKSSSQATYWSYPYVFIQNCNVILANIDAIQAITEADKAELADYKGQALAIRGMSLFELTSRV